MHKEIVNTQKINLHGLVGLAESFLIPSYQREYAWREEQYAKLFQDLKNSFEQYDESEVKDLTYFLGSILTRKNNASLELIDGQQRNTCLMLLALAFKRVGVSTSLLDYPNYQGGFRIKFPIRDSVQAYLDGKLRSPVDDEKWEEVSNSTKKKKNERDPRWFLSQTLLYFTSKLKELVEEGGANESKIEVKNEAWTQNKLIRFGDFIYHRVLLINNEVPASADMEGLFATMNNTGVQLEKHDILKALLLKSIKSKEERALYNSIWMACENMDNYFERNLNEIFSKAPYNVTFKSLNKENLRSFLRFKKFIGEISVDSAEEQGHKNYKRFDEIEENFKETIAGFYHDQLNEESGDNKAAHEDHGAEYCSSIIPFPLLLLHTLRIYQSKNANLSSDSSSIRFHTDNLLKLFGVITSDKSDDVERIVKEFIQCLWEVRFEFDYWVIKWVSLEGERDRMLMLQKLRNPTLNNTFSRDTEEHKSGLSMLQAMRYFVSEHITQFWLTPFLGWLISCNEIPKEDVVLDKLEYIDDALSLAVIDQGDAAFVLLGGSLNDNQISPFTSKLSYLENNSEGTSFKHYWFQKLEYVLWKKSWQGAESDKRLSLYRMVSRNSIEHVYPQNGHKDSSENSEGNIKLDDKYLHDFGNLALLNVSQNSSYSDHYVSTKLAMFQNDTGAYISLKLKHLLDMLKNWNIHDGLEAYRTITNKHKQETLEMMGEHYSVVRETKNG